MKRNLLIVICVLFLASCAPQKLYTWGNYEKTSYNYLKNTDEKSILALTEDYQKIIEKQKGTRGVVPPGIFADYGFLLLQEGKEEEGKEMLIKEVTLYPESKIFIDRILKMKEE
ncbi:MAG: DUF4810 domain-containing protein [Patescibacteria group bacterium]|jgi:hypothetical protein|nr:DUF4810 domain-containing protein [Patescibacteria group bacterium]